MLLSEVKKTVTVTGGSGFFTIPCWQGEIAIVSIVPSGSYEYDVRVVNSHDIVIEEVEDIDNNFLLNEKRLPIRGNATCYIEDATNGNYEVYAAVIEKS